MLLFNIYQSSFLEYLHTITYVFAILENSAASYFQSTLLEVLPFLFARYRPFDYGFLSMKF